MSATNRTIEADFIAIDPDDKKAEARLQEEAEKIAAEGGIDVAIVRRVLDQVRAKKRRTKRAKGDFYETPSWVVDALVPHIPISGEPVVLDAGSGTGAIAARLAEINPKAEIIGVEKNPEHVATARARGLYSVEFKEGNYLRYESEGAAPDLVIMNPPFSFSFEFVQKARAIVRRGGTIAALLRLNWLAGKCRRDFLKKHTPDVHVLSKRPSFTGRGTDATEYAWMVWGPNTSGKITILTHDDKSKRRPRAARTTPPKAKAARVDVVQAQGQVESRVATSPSLPELHAGDQP